MRIPILMLLIFMLTACTPLRGTATMSPDTPVTSPPQDDMPTSEPSANPFSRKPGDDQLSRGTVFLNEVSLLIRESYPPQISLSLRGDLPTPCNELRVEIGSPGAANKILVDVYSVVDPDQACVQVIEPFEEQIDLGTFPAGHYSVWVNGELAGEFDS